MDTITFIGAGKMTEAILSGLLDQKLFKPNNITLSDTSADRLAFLAKKYKIQTVLNNIQAIKNAQNLVLAVKPQVIDIVLAEIAATEKKEQLFISIAAGITLQKLDPKNERKVVRVMPNTPLLVGSGATALTFNSRVTPGERQKVTNIFAACGLVVEVEEKQLNAVTGLSGSGPAFVFQLLKAFISAGIELGLSEKTARELTCQTFKGSADLAASSTQSLEELIEQVTSPNGTTAAGRKILENSDVSEIIKKTITQAKQRADELSSGK